MMDKKINNNGYEYVDLGLPSGTLWATMNVGASKPSDAGLYFQWGDTVGYIADKVGKGSGQKKFARDESDYKFGVYPNYSKYTYKTSLDLEDDAAHVNMGGDWHMPTPDQIEELISTANTTTAWTTSDGVNGRLFTSKKDGSKSIFIPAAGYAWGGSVQGSGGNGDVWSSMLITDGVGGGHCLDFDSGNAGLSYGGRYNGLSVRGVIDKNNDSSKEKKNNMDRNENLDLREILKDAPKGLELWSYACGTCYFNRVIKYSICPIECKTQNKDGGIQTLYFTKEGKRDTIFPNGQCVLFPSKDNQDWTTFKAPENHKHFEPYQKVLVKSYSENHKIWFPDIYLFFEEQNSCHRVAINKYIRNDDNIIPFEGNEGIVGKKAE